MSTSQEAGGEFRGAGELNVREEIARIDREQAETQKFAAEQRKLSAEADKLSAEQAKLYSEAFKLDRDRKMAPWLAAGVLAGGVGGIIIAVVQVVLRLIEVPSPK